MSDDRSPREQVLDLVFYAPAGLVLAAADEVPRLAALGRQELSRQAATAKVVGELAVRFGRGELEKRVNQLLASARPPGPLPPKRRATSPAGPTSAQAPDRSAPADGAGTPGAAGRPRAAGSPAPPRGPGPVTTPSAGERTSSHLSGSPTVPGPVDRARAGGGGDGADLAIPGYDSLSASQVVQRLEGLDPAELDAVRAYEIGHRARRTVLNKADQLRAGRASGEAVTDG